MKKANELKVGTVLNNGMTYEGIGESNKKGVPVHLFSGDASFYYAACRKAEKKGVPCSDNEGIKIGGFIWGNPVTKVVGKNDQGEDVSEFVRSRYAITVKSWDKIKDVFVSHELPEDWKKFVKKVSPGSTLFTKETGATKETRAAKVTTRAAKVTTRTTESDDIADLRAQIQALMDMIGK